MSIRLLLLITITIIISYGKKLSNLVKNYINKVKYNNYNNSFTFKLAIFYDIYLKADISSKTIIKVFSIILKGLASDYYYLNSNTSNIMNFN